MEVVELACERGYVPLPGEDIPLPPGPRMVCPVDPAHYQIFRREADEELICPEHGVRLVLAD